MNDLLDEVKDDLKYESTLKFIRKALPFVIVFILSLIVIICLRTWWVSHTQNIIFKDGADYVVAMNNLGRSQNLSEANKKFEEVAKGNTSFSALSNLNIAAYATYQKDFDKALKFFNEVEKNSKFADVFREYARLQIISISLDQGKIDRFQAIKDLEKYISHKGIFIPTAKEILLNLYINEAKYDAAKKLVGELISDESTPTSMIERIKAVSKLEGIEKK